LGFLKENYSHEKNNEILGNVLISVCDMNDNKIIELITEHINTNKYEIGMKDFHNALIINCNHGYTYLLTFLLEHYNTNEYINFAVSNNSNIILKNACRFNNDHVVIFIINLIKQNMLFGLSMSDYLKSLEMSFIYNHYCIMKILFTNFNNIVLPNLDFDFDSDSDLDLKCTLNKIFKWTCDNNEINIFKILFQHFKSIINLSMDRNYPIRIASEYGYIEIVIALINEDTIDPSDMDHYAFKYACENGHTDVVKILLNNNKINPSIMHSHGFRMAAKNGHIEIIKILLEDGRSDPKALDNYALKMATINYHTDIINILKLQ
jgi:ankyrin repeat protein